MKLRSACRSHVGLTAASIGVPNKTQHLSGVVQRCFLKSAKEYADYASKIWAAVLAAVLFLYEKVGTTPAHVMH